MYGQNMTAEIYSEKQSESTYFRLVETMLKGYKTQSFTWP